MKIFKWVLIMIILVFMMFVLTGCSETEKESNEIKDTEMFLTPMFLPSANGSIKMIMMPRVRTK